MLAIQKQSVDNSFRPDRDTQIPIMKSNDVFPGHNVFRMKMNARAPDGNDERHKMRVSSTVQAVCRPLVETTSEQHTVTTQVHDVHKWGVRVSIKDNSSTGSDIIIRSFNKRGPTMEIG